MEDIKKQQISNALRGYCERYDSQANGTDNQIDGEMKADYCAVQDNYEGENMIALSAENEGETPDNFIRFTQPAEGAGADYHDADWSLMPRSICLNAGKPTPQVLAKTTSSATSASKTDASKLAPTKVARHSM